MARVLYDGLVEYEDGTPATTSQMAKDVVEFLNWAAEPEMDVRKQMGIKTVVITSALLALSIWVKRFDIIFSSRILSISISSVTYHGQSLINDVDIRQRWASLKSRKIVYNPPPEARR